jgi:hypothetical protein
LNGLWAIVFVVAPGLFQPLEQEVGRAIAHRRAQGIGAEPLVKRAAVLGAILATVIAALAAIFSKPLIDNLFHGYGWLLPALFVALACYYVAHITRGTLAGNGRFAPYGLMHASEGIVSHRLLLILVLAGTTAVGLYGVALALPPLFAVAIALRGQHGLLQPGPAAPYSELSSALGLLLVGSLLAQLLSYASFIGVTLLAPNGSDAAGLFITGLFVARIPLLMFQAVQPRCYRNSRARGEGRHDDFVSDAATAVHRDRTGCVRNPARDLPRAADRQDPLRRQVGPRRPRHVPAHTRGVALHHRPQAGTRPDPR